MNYLGEFFHRYFPTFAALAQPSDLGLIRALAESLREIIRVSVAALPR
jgi:hypothetical protein